LSSRQQASPEAVRREVELASRLSCSKDSIEIDSALFILQASWIEARRGGGRKFSPPSPSTILVWRLGKNFAKRVPLARKSPKEIRADDTNKFL